MEKKKYEDKTIENEILKKYKNSSRENREKVL